MKFLWPETFNKPVGIAVLAALLLNGSFLLVHWYVVSPIGFGGRFILAIYSYFVLPFIVFSLLASLLIIKVYLFLPKLRPRYVNITVCAFTYLVVCFAFFCIAVLAWP